MFAIAFKHFGPQNQVLRVLKLCIIVLAVSHNDSIKSKSKNESETRGKEWLVKGCKELKNPKPEP